jgi:hypothetical protein
MPGGGGVQGKGDIEIGGINRFHVHLHLPSKYLLGAQGQNEGQH